MSRRRASLDALQRLDALETDIHRGLTAEAAHARRVAEDAHADREDAVAALSKQQREALASGAVIDGARIETLGVAAEAAARTLENAREEMARATDAHDTAMDALAQVQRGAKATSRRVERQAREATSIAERRADQDIADLLRKGKSGD